jgi:uncharacterized membrane protein
VFYYLVLFKAYSLLPAQLAQPLKYGVAHCAYIAFGAAAGTKNWQVEHRRIVYKFCRSGFHLIPGRTCGFQNTSFTGVLLALGSSVFWSLYWILNVRDNRDGVVKLFLNFLFGLLFLTVVMYFFSDFRVQPGTGLYAAIYVGIFEVGITYVFWMKAMQLSTNNAKIGNMVFLTPFLSLIFIRFILNETLFITTFIGLAFIVAGIFVQQLDRKKSFYKSFFIFASDLEQIIFLKLTCGVIGNTSDSGSEESRFEPWQVNKLKIKELWFKNHDSFFFFYRFSAGFPPVFGVF